MWEVPGSNSGLDQHSKSSVRFEGKNVLNSFSNEIEKADSVELYKKNLRCDLHNCNLIAWFLVVKLCTCVFA